MPKRKRDRVADPTNKSTQSLPTCIVHVTSITDHGCFTPLSQVRGTASDKLQQICEIRDRRLLQSSDSPYRMQSICDQIPTTLPADLENTGYHRQCYQRFTGNLIRLEDGTTPVSATTPQRRQSTRKSSSPGSKRHIFAPDCIFCEKLETKCGDRKTERAEDFPSWTNKENAWQQIAPRAELMGLHRLHRGVKDVDLFAAEAKHHPSFLRSFRIAFANYERGNRITEEGDDTEQARVLTAHEKALACVLDHVTTHVVNQKGVVRLSSLWLIYIEELKRNGHDNSNYRSEKLLKRLQNDSIIDVISFMKVDHEAGAISFWLVYSSNITVCDALARAYTLGSGDKYQDVALLLRNIILRAFKVSKELDWPPTADDMQLSCEDLLPQEVIRFLSLVMAGKEAGQSSEKTRRLIFFVGQHLCRAVSKGEWKLPKHMLLCVSCSEASV